MTRPYQRRPAIKTYRSLFLSDFHLGARGCQAEAILEFLSGTRAGTIYLVGDIFDLWHCGTVHWSRRHDRILAVLLRQARAGTRLVFLPGNHDAMLREHLGQYGPMVEIRDRAVHRTADGSRYIVLHGDQCDSRLLQWHVMTHLGSRTDALLRRIDGWLRRGPAGTDRDPDCDFGGAPADDAGQPRREPGHRIGPRRRL